MQRGICSALNFSSTKEIIGEPLFDLAPFLSAKSVRICFANRLAPSQLSAEALNFSQDKLGESTYWDWKRNGL